MRGEFPFAGEWVGPNIRAAKPFQTRGTSLKRGVNEKLTEPRQQTQPYAHSAVAVRSLKRGVTRLDPPLF